MSNKETILPRQIPNHDEYYSKVILEWYDNSKYKDLILQDKPDLYCKALDIGIEVTSAPDSKKKEAQSLWLMLPYSSGKKKEKRLEQIDKLGFECDGGIFSRKSYGDESFYNRGPASLPYMPIYSAIENKVKKLSKGQYQKCSKYELFITKDDIYLETDWLSYLLKNCKKKNINNSFSKIYICTCSMLIDLDFERNKSSVREISEQRHFEEIACKLMETMKEKDE